MIAGKTILITGGTGSFGRTVAQRMLEADAGQIRIFSRDEEKQHYMRLTMNHQRLRFYVGDVRDYGSVLEAMLGVDLVFHAAALKQVPSCEFYPMEAVRTNVIGSDNVLTAALAHNVERVVMLSTDKAVYPINAMGMSKAMMEKVTVAKSRLAGSSRTVLCVTRYGNVMASRGSVIPLFVEQIKAGEPLTVTDPNMTRFLMSLPDSVDLVLHAYAHGRSGDIFVQKAPACTLGDLAAALLDIFGSKAGIRIIGTRHGEKLFETLVAREEMARAESSDRYFRIPLDARDLNYSQFFTEGETTISQAEDYTSDTAERFDRKAVTKLLLGLDYIREQIAPTQYRPER